MSKSFSRIFFSISADWTDEFLYKCKEQQNKIAKPYQGSVNVDGNVNWSQVAEAWKYGGLRPSGGPGAGVLPSTGALPGAHPPPGATPKGIQRF